jgi:hypothetical protein
MLVVLEPKIPKNQNYPDQLNLKLYLSWTLIINSALFIIDIAVRSSSSRCIKINRMISMNVINEMKNRFVKRLRGIANPPERDRLIERQLILHSFMIAKMNRSLESIGALSEAEFSGFSQWGEDGIIDWLVEKLPGIPEIYVEFGVEDYRESNTRLLLYLRNWRGLVMDGSHNNIDSIKQHEIYWRYDLTAKHAFITSENVNDLIASSGLSGEIGLLSIDIDGNDYWVWQSIEVVNPVIVVCEYNGVFGDLNQLSVPYRSDFDRSKAHYSRLYFGASLNALIELADHKGYVFVGTNSNGCNAFFVRRDRSANIVKSIREIRSFPPAIRESHSEFDKLTHIAGLGRLNLINNLPVYDFSTNMIRPISDFGRLYSSKWIEKFY